MLYRIALALLLVATPALAQTSLEQGEYLARAGDCFSCHTGTDKGAIPLAGGRQLQTPFGTLSSPNITPDKETGIGLWTDDDFYKAMHDGIARDGTLLYPLMPFDHYTKVTRADAMLIKAYLFSVPPVHAPRQESHLSFPYNIRESLAAWRLLFFKPATFVPDPARSAAENRGAYLVEGLGHCGACHTPRNQMGASVKGAALGGGEITGQGWFAPNISSDIHEGIGAWTDEQLIAFLKTGITPGHAIAAGPMAETIHTSLRYLTDDDLHAIAAFLKVAPAKTLYAETTAPAPEGTALYLEHCGICHQPNGAGLKGAVPNLAGSGVVGAGGPDDVIRTILGGMSAHGSYAVMPGMATQLSPAEIAAIANYIRGAWGNTAPQTATAGMVGTLAASTQTMLSGTASCDPVPPALASQLVGQGLEGINAGNMLEQIPLILGHLPAATAAEPKAELVNGLIAAYCPIVAADTKLTPAARLEQLQEFAALAYAQVSK
jgi:mono/diheme cytochrome c family protein